MFYFSVFILIIGIILCILGYTSIYKKQQENTIIKKENERLEKINTDLQWTRDDLNQKCANLRAGIEEKVEEFARIDKQVSAMENNVQTAFKNYCEVLDKDYDKKEEEYIKLEMNLKNNYNILQENVLKDLQKVKNDLEKIQQTRAAAIEAERKEKEIEENLSFYCVQPTEEELDDIQVLNRIKSKLHQPRILCMLIWSTYYQKPMTNLCNNVLGTSIVTGIYKITNQITKQCYIGQAADVASRWKQHAKCGLGIDTPATNKLYKSMLEDGLHNFSFELLEECPRDQLNEKEKFYISLYLSNEFGYNSNKGIG